MLWTDEEEPLLDLPFAKATQVITKVLIGLHRCTGWYVPSLFACNKVRFSGVEAHLEYKPYNKINQKSVLNTERYLFIFYTLIHSRQK